MVMVASRWGFGHTPDGGHFEPARDSVFFVYRGPAPPPPTKADLWNICVTLKENNSVMGTATNRRRQEPGTTTSPGGVGIKTANTAITSSNRTRHSGIGT